MEASFQDRCAAVRATLRANGVNVSQWARERGFNPKLVIEVLRGERSCLRGQSHQIAVALGIKAAPVRAPAAALTSPAPSTDAAPMALAA